ncbi:S8 family serine peptidase [Shewanella sp. GXUN23E]|uniref:S8 family serine peptidase n=1 Tax=Shewanella sp. GXUN23E TaxID=3422498 RepID=UPI003D7D77DE
MMVISKVSLAVSVTLAVGMLPAQAISRGPEVREGQQTFAVSRALQIQKIGPGINAFATDNNMLPLIVELNSPAYRTLQKQARQREARAVAQISKEIRSLTRDFGPKGSFASKDEELKAWSAVQGSQPAGLKARMMLLNQQREQIITEQREEFKTRATSILAPSQLAFSQMIESLGGKVTEFIDINHSAAIQLPAQAVDSLAQEPLVISINLDNPGEPELNNQAQSLGVSAFWNDGEDGGVWDVGILDSGVEETHDALVSHTIEEHYTGNGYHGTGVACMYASNNSTYKGLAFGLDKILVDDAGSESTSMAGANWMVSSASDDPEVINYSWGNGSAATSTWGNMARFVDGIVHNKNLIWAKSAGNAGYGTATTMTQPGENYNGITVANMNDMDTVSRADDVINSDSSRGPTYDGRKKPDISAPGNRTYTCTTGNSYANLGGTSSAAPKVGAVSLLLRDSGHYYPISMKATMINTADSWEDNDTQTTSDDGQVTGKEWNRTYGWGYLDAAHAEFHKDDFFIDTIGKTGANNDYRLYVGQNYIGDKSTIVWERDVEYDSANTPTSYRDLSDINLRLYDEDSETLEDSDFSSKDNVHQVAATSTGRKVIKVYAWNSSQNETVALATEENFERAEVPSFTLTKSYTSAGLLGYYNVKVTMANQGTIKAHDITAKITLPTGISLISPAASVAVTDLAAGAGTSATWLVYKSPLASLGGIHYTVTSQSYGEVFSNTL